MSVPRRQARAAKDVTVFFLLVGMLFVPGCIRTNVKGTLNLTVQEKTTGLPVKKAKIKIFPVQDPKKQLKSGETDTQGRAKFQLPKGAYTIFIDKSGYVQNAEDTNKVIQESANYVTIYLEEQVEIYGFVMEPDDSPAENVLIEALNQTTNEVFTGRTMSDGSYSIRNIPAGRYAIKFQSMKEIADGSSVVSYRQEGIKQLREQRLELNIKLERVVVDHQVGNDLMEKENNSSGGGAAPVIN